MGYVLGIVILAASIQDRRGVKTLGFHLAKKFTNIQVIFVDGGYTGEPIKNWFFEMFHIVLIVVKRTCKTFKILPKRWIVERTFGWWNWYRRLSKDYEYNPERSKSHCEIATIRVLLKRIERKIK